MELTALLTIKCLCVVAFKSANEFYPTNDVMRVQC